MKIISITLLLFLFSEANSKFWLPENKKDHELFERIISQLKVNNDSVEQTFISSMYSTCDWCKLIFEDSLFLRTSFVFPKSDQSIMPLISKEFKSSSIAFSSDLFYLLEYLGLEKSSNFLIQFNTELKYLRIQEINKNNYKALLKNQSKLELKTSNLGKLPTGSYQLRLRCTVDKGTYFTDIRNRLFFIPTGDSFAILQNSILHDFEYDSIIRLYDKRNNVVTDPSKLKLANIEGNKRIVIESIIPYKNGLKYLVSLSYLLKQNGDTFTTENIELFIEEDSSGKRIYKPILNQYLNKGIKLGYAIPFTFYQSLENDFEIIRIDINELDIKGKEFSLPRRIPIAVKLKIAPTIITTAQLDRTWKFIQTEKLEKSKRDFIYMDRKFFMNETHLRPKSGAKFFHLANQFIYLENSHYVYDFETQKPVKIDWLEKFSKNSELNFRILSMEYLSNSNQYLFSMYSNKGMFLILASDKFELDHIDFFPIKGISSNIYVLNRKASYLDGNMIKLIEFNSPTASNQNTDNK
jgi:hypothetical protein